MQRIIQRLSTRHTLQSQRTINNARLFSTNNNQSHQQQEPRPNTIQRMQSYQKALELATDKKFEESLVALRSTMTEIEDQIGENTNFHLFLYQKIASLQILLYDLEGVEESFKKCIEVAEKTRTPLNPKLD